MMGILTSEIFDDTLEDLASLQRPFYWPWGLGFVSNANNTRWPRREDKLKFRPGKHKDVATYRVKIYRPGATSAFITTDNSRLVTPFRTTVDYSTRSEPTSTDVDLCNVTNCKTSPSDTWTTFISALRSDVVTLRSTSSYTLPTNRSVIGLLNNSTELFDSAGGSVNSGGNGTYGTFGLLATYASNPAYINNVSDYDGHKNGTWLTDDDDASTTELAIMVSTAISLGLVILATVIGNVFVIAAILLERNLQSVANYLILSLAVADLLVACLVMPLGAVYEVSKQWTLGPELCDMWTSSDVLCCTASILHLVAIALDRYWAVTNIDYIHQRTARRIGLMILVIWLVATSVCIAPLLGWKDPEWELRIYINQTCLVSQDIGYQIFATASSFYVPLLVILILYWRIFQTARKRIRRRGGGQGGPSHPKNPAAGGVVAGAAGGSGGIAAAVVAVIGRPLPTISETTTAFTTVSSTNTSPEKHPLGNGIEPDLPTADCFSSYQHSMPYPIPIKLKKNKEAADSKRERKAAKTLAIITGAFVVCWLPFFILAILLPTCKTCEVNPHLVSFFLWLGYLNSTINPIIYTIFSPEFRHAFKRLLCGRRSSIRRRNVRHFGPRHFQ